MKSNLIPQIVPNLIWRQVEENTVVVSPQSGEMRVLNGVGSEIWQFLADNKTPDFIINHLVSRYEISPEQAQDDLQNFLTDLETRQLLEWVSG